MDKLKQYSIGTQVDFTTEIIQSLQKKLSSFNNSAKFLLEPSEARNQLDNLVISSKKHFKEHGLAMQSQSSVGLFPDSVCSITLTQRIMEEMRLLRLHKAYAERVRRGR